MRGLVPGLKSAAPLAPRLPAILQEDEFLQRFLAAFDDSLAPVFATLDGLVSYFDPRIAPDDFVDLLAEWVGLRLEDEWPLGQRRQLVASAAALHARRGTAAGVADAVRLAVRGVVDVEVTDTGGIGWSTSAGGELPGSATPEVHVSVMAKAQGDVDPRSLEAVVSAVIPGHVLQTIEIVIVGPADEDLR